MGFGLSKNEKGISVKRQILLTLIYLWKQILLLKANASGNGIGLPLRTEEIQKWGI
jgi:hypothetical protein